MGFKFQKSKSDANASEIDALLIAAHCSVLKLDMVGRGCPDRLIGFSGKNYLVEYKYEKNKLQQIQKEFINQWRGAPVIIAYSFDDIWKIISATA